MEKDYQLKINDKIMQKIDDLTQAVEDIKITLAGLPDEIFTRADERYASKTAERAIYGLVGALCLGIVYILINTFKI